MEQFILLCIPSEAISTETVDTAQAAGSIVPESASVPHCAVVVVATVDPRIVVAVIGGERHPVVVSQSIASIALVLGHQ